MAQTIAKFLEFDHTKEGKNIKNPYAVWRMENREGWFWVRFTKRSFISEANWDANKQQNSVLVGTIAILSGYWGEVDKKSWKGSGFRVDYCYLLPDKFLISCWEDELKDIPEKSLREKE